MTQRTDFTSRSGKPASGEIAVPRGTGKAPAVVLVQEWWGVNDHVRSLVDRLAAEGFLVLAPDLYHGRIAKDAGEAGKLMQSLDWKQAMDELGGAVSHLASHPRSTGMVGIMGFCMGGALAFAAATKIPELSAAVPFYGVPSGEWADWSKVRAPIQAHFAKRDEWAKASIAEHIKKQLEDSGQTMELFVYDADHAFVNDTRPEVHAPDAAKTAWHRAVTFLKKNLS
jgi:carboxymethylenebutenolidase